MKNCKLVLLLSLMVLTLGLTFTSCTIEDGDDDYANHVKIVNIDSSVTDGTDSMDQWSVILVPSNPDPDDDTEIGNEGFITEGFLDVVLKEYDGDDDKSGKAWKGNGSYYVYFNNGMGKGKKYVTKNPITFSKKITTIDYSAFEEDR
jgi:hypothetical protein